jgi:hypothetical protein
MTTPQKVFIGAVLGVTAIYLLKTFNQSHDEKTSSAAGPNTSSLSETDRKGKTNPGYFYNKTLDTWVAKPKPKLKADSAGECFCRGAWGKSCCL